ncbi:hypothetical protein GFY24_33335 [Nocardia sp. SYP-A9097]|uniref:hypothetical protein n=1 Tax=Nocardia sp. SYP-A9097 TaxID=2663237 RepID=UPI00129AF025|nr:hypothetical protein [Nocardia sp. SYP-A9097]MRH92262.1 hypothetical protein [Nocardia sp. SYP-A9097]
MTATIAASGPLSPCTDKDPTKPDCTLQSTDSTELGFTVRHTGTGRNGTLTIEVTNPDGTAAQSITESKVEADAPRPKLLDTDADGRDELLIPLTVGPGGTEYAVYHATGTEFTRAGEFTTATITSTSDGYTVTAATVPGHTYTFWTYDSDKLIPLLTAEVTNTECAITKAPNLSRTGFTTLSAAQSHFCADPAITN